MEEASTDPSFYPWLFRIVSFAAYVLQKKYFYSWCAVEPVRKDPGSPSYLFVCNLGMGPCGAKVAYMLDPARANDGIFQMSAEALGKSWKSNPSVELNVSMLKEQYHRHGLKEGIFYKASLKGKRLSITSEYSNAKSTDLPESVYLKAGEHDIDHIKMNGLRYNIFVLHNFLHNTSLHTHIKYS